MVRIAKDEVKAIPLVPVEKFSLLIGLLTGFLINENKRIDLKERQT